MVFFSSFLLSVFICKVKIALFNPLTTLLVFLSKYLTWLAHYYFCISFISGNVLKFVYEVLSLFSSILLWVVVLRTCQYVCVWGGQIVCVILFLNSTLVASLTLLFNYLTVINSYSNVEIMLEIADVLQKWACLKGK